MTELLKDLVMPSNFTTVGLVVGTALALFGRTRRVGLGVTVASVCLFVMFCSGVVAALLLSPLEYQYPSVERAAQYPEARAIVVLAGYAAPDALMPLSSRMNSHTAFRILEAQRLHSECPSCTILVSGGDAAPDIVKEMLVASGVDDSAIVLDSASPHTDASAARLAPRLGKEPFFLVTSAGHMARAVGVFRRHGMKPVPAPTDYLMPRNIFSASIQTRIQHLYFADLAVREYAGIAWYKFLGRM